MLDLLEQILPRLRAGETIALCTVVAARGSTPQQRGAKMAVLTTGQSLGTLGGGCVEAEVRTQALQQIASGQSKTLSFRLDHDYGWDDGLICGGIMDIHIDVLNGLAAAEKFQSIVDSIANRIPADFSFAYSLEGSQQIYREEILPPPNLVIAGAGHVGCALAAIMRKLDFDITIIDDRADLVTSDRFPEARRIIGDVESELAHLRIDPQTYVVIVTRGHRHDGRALGAVIQSPAQYIGLIGSKRKIRTIFGDLHEQGIPFEKLTAVHAPIGLAIGAISVNEIAVSIAAELIAVRRGKANQPAAPMKMSPDAIKTWLDRKSLHQ